MRNVDACDCLQLVLVRCDRGVRRHAMGVWCHTWKLLEIRFGVCKSRVGLLVMRKLASSKRRVTVKLASR